MPTIVVLHTVLSNPDPLQRSVLERIVAAADAVVTMTDTARQRLTAGYRVDAAQDLGDPARRGQPHQRAARPATTAAPAHLGAARPGQGHRVGAARARRCSTTWTRRRSTRSPGGPTRRCWSSTATSYRDSLKQLAADLGVADAVRWADVYLDQAALSRLIRSADVVVLPYDSTEQVTSGVLIEAVGAGVPVVATEFPHAVELLADGPGLLVPHQDPEAMAAAIRRLLAEPGRRPSRADRAGRRPDAALAGGGRPVPGRCAGADAARRPHDRRTDVHARRAGGHARDA